MPDLRPSMPLSSGPTLFLAPSPTAWQAMHLLNDVLPAAASCASAGDAAAIEGMAASAGRGSFFMRCSLSGLGGCERFWHGMLAMDKPRNAPRFHDFISRFI